jgi:hypothetical protein
MSEVTLEQAKSIGEVCPQGLPSEFLPRWMESILRRLKRLDSRLAFEVQHHYVPWLELANQYGIDMKSMSAAEAFVQVKLARIREWKGEANEAEIRSELDPNEPFDFESLRAWALGQVISDMIVRGVGEGPQQPTWWEAAVASLIALEPTFDARGVGLEGLPHWGSTAEDDLFNCRELVADYVPDDLRFGEEGDRLWSLAVSSAIALEPQFAKENLSSFVAAQEVPNLDLEDPRVAESILNVRLFSRPNASKAMAVYEKVAAWPHEAIPRTSLSNLLGVPATSVDAFWESAPDRPGKTKSGNVVSFSRSFMLQFVVLSWKPRS